MTPERWTRLYEDGNYVRGSYLDGEKMPTYAVTFFEEMGIPESMVSVGCGPAETEFELAERFPEVTIACYDVAEPVIEDNSEIANEYGLENIIFEVASLPDLELDHTFDIVYCVATLYFVANVEAAIESLYEYVKDGGYLIVNYPTEELQEWVARQDEPKRSFFEIVLKGQNLTTAEEIEALLDAPVESYWSVVDADVKEEMVYIPK